MPLEWCNNNIEKALQDGRFCKPEMHNDIDIAIASFGQGLQDVPYYSGVMAHVYTQVSQKIHLYKY